MADCMRQCSVCGFDIPSFVKNGKRYIETHTKPGTVEERRNTECAGSRKEVK